MATQKSTVAILGPGKVPVTVEINGKPYTANLEPCITLLDAMREFWGLTGAKRACDRATCGACTVLVNGKREYSCSLLAIDVQDDPITTVESLDSDGELDPVQRAFIDHDAMQCGFCTPGFVMSCKGFLAENPAPTPEEILKGMSGNLCRCGSYAGIQQAVAEAAAAPGGKSARLRARAPRARAPRARRRSRR
ncbi:MAG: (2Fe-2S)-binding protein [Acidobacteriia bacterium]|nr:(2Fe-2S)-binding protein [Terriglobia bacterium]